MRDRVISHGVFLLVVVFLVGPALASAGPDVSRSMTLGLNSIEKMKSNGEYVIEVFRDDKWLEAGHLSFDRYYRDRAISLANFIDDVNKPLKIRLTEKGGGAAHIDSISLGGMPPSDARVFGTGAIQELSLHSRDETLKKISKKDFDVIDAFEKTLEFTFISKGKDQFLRLTARVEPVVISQMPFQFPPQNLYRTMTGHASFYRYRLDSSKGNLNLTEVSKQEPFFKEFSKSGSGHPSGFTYGWVRNDETNLYVAIDFTADDTYDGDKDYAKVYIKTEGGFKEFKVSVPETKWGKPSFTYTDKVAYQHKVYEFKIPLNEVGGKRAKKDQELQLAFAAYGTASPGDNYPKLAYDPVNNRFLLVFVRVDSDGNADIYGQLIKPGGSPYGSEFPVSDEADYQSDPSVAYDSVNHRFLVAWRDHRDGNADIYGQLVNADGSLYNTASNVNFVISNDSSSQLNPSVAYDSVNHRFLVAWYDNRNGAADIYGQLINADGSLYNTASNTNFVISNSAGDQAYPSTAFDNANQRFLVAWHDYRNGNADIYGQLVNANGSMYNTNFAISDASDGQMYPSVAYDSVNHRFLVVWGDHRTGSYDIYGQLVNANGSMYNTASNVNFVISDVNQQYSPLLSSAAYDSANQRFLVAWSDNRNSNLDIYGQLVNANGSLYDTAYNVNFVISNASNTQYNPSLAYNSNCGNFLTAYETNETGVWDIGFAVVGPPCCTPPPPGMVSWWKGEDNTYDSVGTNNGSLMGNATYASGMVGRAFSLDGAETTYVEIPNTSSFSPSGAFAVDGWFYIDPSVNAGKIATLVAKTEGSTGNGWALYFDDRGSTKSLKFVLGSVLEVTNAIPSAGWYHVAGVYDPLASPQATLYVNGVSMGSTNCSGATTNGFNVRIGAMYWTDTYHQGNDRLNGKADEVEFFNRALTADEIAAIYNADSDGKCSYAIGTNSPSNGTIVCRTPVAPGIDAVCTMAPADGYHLSALTDNTVDVLGSVIGGTYTIPSVTQPHIIDATFTEYLIKLFKHVADTVSYYDLPGDAFGGASVGDINDVLLRQGTFTGSPNFNRPGVSVNLKGGFGSGFGSNAGQFSTIGSSLTITAGAINMENVVIH